MKKRIAFLLPLLILTALCGCQKQTPGSSEEASFPAESLTTSAALPAEESSYDTTNETTSAALPAEESSYNTAAETTSAAQGKDQEGDTMIPYINVEQKEVPETESLRFVRGLKAGWNLGNTMDATREGGYSEENDLSLEWAWVGVKTTEDMIQNLKDAGYRTLRLPVSWHNHLVDEDFTISPQWLDRVQEILDFALNRDMYVILNIHHDIDHDYLYPAKEYLETSEKYIKAIWSQLSERFASYDQHLIFEAMNEPRLAGTQYEWWLDMQKPECKEAVDCVNRLNQLFVDTVRSFGGNNAQRYLMVPAYSAASENAANEAFQLPQDSADDRLIVSVHAYKPYSFALQGPQESGSTDAFDHNAAADRREIDASLDMVYERFVANGIPVVIGEFGARDKGGNLQARVDMTAYFAAAATARGIPCIWWDNNAFTGSGENFGLLERRNNTWKYPEIVAAHVRYAFPEN